MQTLSLVSVLLLALVCVCYAQDPISYTFNQTQRAQPYGSPSLQNNFFGWSMSMDFNASYMVVGAPLACQTSGSDFNGKAYTYRRVGELGSASLSWENISVLTNPQTQNYAFFGQAVWVGLNNSGDAMVAVFSMRSNREGRVYLFSKPSAAANFTHAAAYANPSPLLPVFSGQSYRFGEAITGDLRVNRLVIGSFRYLAKTGAAYVYTYGGTNWAKTQDLEAPTEDQAENSGYGISLFMDNDYLAVGASGFGLNRGKVYIYHLDSGSYLLTKAIRPLDGAIGDQFGWSVALRDDTLAVGSNRREDCGIACGAAYIFMQNLPDDGNISAPDTDNWGQLLRINRDDAQAGEQFGTSISINGDFLVVGAPERTIGNTTVAAGSVYVFQRNTNDDGYFGANGWGQVGIMTHDDIAVRDRLGRCVATYAPHVLTSAMLYDKPSSNSGGVFMFYGDNIPLGGLSGNPPVAPNDTTTDPTSTTSSSTTATPSSEIAVSAAEELAWVLTL